MVISTIGMVEKMGSLDVLDPDLALYDSLYFGAAATGYLELG